MPMTKNDFKKLEDTFKRGAQKTDKHRSKDPREAYLNPEMLMDRRILTRGGRQKLALDYGFKGEKREFSLAQLSEFAKKIEARQGKFESSVKGVVVGDLVRMSLPVDKQRAKDIAAATLYKLEGNTLYFRVTASGETHKGPSYYLVRVRLEEWHDQIKDSAAGNSYILAAQRASYGHVSFDCGCSRHQFWFRYLATIGGFGLTPEEHVFPKIRNRHLKGACCKHVLKTLMVLQGSVIRGAIAKNMEAEAKRKGFGSKKPKYLTPHEVEQMETASTAEFEKMRKAFLKASSTQQAKQALEALEPKRKPQTKGRNMKQLDDATKVIAAEGVIKRLKADQRKAFVGTLKSVQAVGQPLEPLIKAMGANPDVKITEKELMQIAKEEGLL